MTERHPTVRAGSGPPEDVQIRELGAPAELREAVDLFDQVWGSARPLVAVELVRAIAHAGGYVAAAYRDGVIIGASLGFLGRHDGQPALHSHVTGIVAGARDSGIGRALKLHQRAWAAAHGLPWVTWTFDPLVRRNARFNVHALGAEVHQYLVDFYGPIDDAINLRDESDRLLVAWPTDESTPRPAPDAGRERRRVPTPENIVALRRSDPAAARGWRTRVRDELGGALGEGFTVVDVTSEGEYLLQR